MVKDDVLMALPVSGLWPDDLVSFDGIMAELSRLDQVIT